MSSNDLETIAASMQDALHRAYALGRSDALRRVVELVQEDELGAKTVALLAHSKPPAVEAPRPETQQIEAQPIRLLHAEADSEAETAAAPGEAAQNGNAERADAPRREERTPPASMKDFLLDYLYPLGGKK